MCGSRPSLPSLFLRDRLSTSNGQVARVELFFRQPRGLPSYLNGYVVKPARRKPCPPRPHPWHNHLDCAHPGLSPRLIEYQGFQASSPRQFDTALQIFPQVCAVVRRVILTRLDGRRPFRRKKCILEHVTNEKRWSLSRDRPRQ